MSATLDFAAARARYVACNAASLRWMLARPPLQGGFLNTKVNSLTLADYTRADGWRGPDFTYGWIQGRGLEALTTHAAFFVHEDAALAEALDAAGRRLYMRLAALFERHEGHAYFCYDAALEPVIRGADGAPMRQRAAGELFTFADAFVIKGLLAGAMRYGDAGAVKLYLARLAELVAAVEQGRFVADEQRPFDHAPDPRRADEFGPWMIVLAAAGLLKRLGFAQEAAFGARWVERVLTLHRGANDLTPDHVGATKANPGHAIEFVGFACEALGEAADAATREALLRVLTASFEAGFSPPGLLLSVDARDGAPLSAYRPWWSLPETIRAAALAHELTGESRALSIWADADSAFFTHYWRADAGLAYQTRDDRGPVDYVPATPDLDPGYHTGLSLLGAIEAIDRRGAG